MSGFLLQIRHGTEKSEVAFRSSLSFAIHKIKKIYSLHMITMICIVVLSLAPLIKHAVIERELAAESVASLLLQIGFHITLLQSWLPIGTIYASLNHVAWFLSDLFFLYFMFPCIRNLLNRRKISFGILTGIGILLLEVTVFLALKDSEILGWVMYRFPVFRLGDFYIGVVLGKYYQQKQLAGISRRIYPVKLELMDTVSEILTAVVTVCICSWLNGKLAQTVVGTAQDMTPIYIVLSALWIYLFARRAGLITKLLSNKPLIYLGNISADCYLIHYVVILYTGSFLNCMNMSWSAREGWGIALADLFLTIILAVVYGKCAQKHIIRE
jgi:peptidoglycan/LPS O-acetylase OafA/YrhL